MSSVGLTSGEEFLRDAARRFFEDLYERPTMHVNQELSKGLPWTPALRFVINDYINVFVEPSETGPYPRILEMRHADVLQFPEPIAVYAVCPEEMILTAERRSDVKRLQMHGFGLITVNRDGLAHREFISTPLVQIIPDADCKAAILDLPKRHRQKIGLAYEDYKNKPVTGVTNITELIEGLIIQAGKDVVRKKWLSKSDLGTSIATTLDALHDAKQCKNARPAIGGARSYISEYRNLSHHWPKNKKKAHQKYTECRHAFLDGLKQIRRFRDAMRDLGLSGNLPAG